MPHPRKRKETMRKMQVLGAVFFAVLAFVTISVASASAAQWLVGGKAITTAQHAVTEGKWLLLALSFGGFVKTHVTCNGVLLGTVGPGAKDEVSKVYGLTGESETTINCTVLSAELGACSGSTLALVKAEHLPWATELLEPKAGEFVDHFKSSGAGLPAFSVECTLSNSTKFTELCEGEVLTDALTNEPGGVFGKELNQLSSKCKTAGNVGHVEGEGEVKTLSGTLSVSK
jgi:hypothetical protein